MQNSVLPEFCASFDVLSCEVLPESGGVGTSAEIPFTMRKERKEFQLCDSRRLRKKEQDTQDAVLRFLKFSVSVALTMRLKFLIFLRFSVYYAIYDVNWCFEIFEIFNFNRADKAFDFFLSNGDSGYYNTIRIRRGPKQVATKVPPSSPGTRF